MLMALAPAHVKGNQTPRQQWAVDQLFKIAQASKNFGLTNHATFSGALLWPTFTLGHKSQQA